MTHATTYKKALVDLISMVKHAANEQHPLYSAPERVEKAMIALNAAHSFDAEEVAWLERIRTHLQENLSIDREDFDNQLRQRRALELQRHQRMEENQRQDHARLA